MQTVKAFSILILIACVLPFAGRGEDTPPAGDVVISQQRDGGVIQIYAENTSAKTLAITLQLSNILHAKSEGWPTKITKRCFAGDRIMMTALIQAEGEPASTFTCTVTTSTNLGPSPTPQRMVITIPAPSAQPPAAPAHPASEPPKEEEPQAPLQPVDPDFAYRLPYEPGSTHMISQGYGGVVSHRGVFALDFDMPMNTPVCAARDGVVVELQKSRGSSDDDSVIGNFVAIKHVDGTVALYAQLATDGVQVVVGQRVRAGDIIGSSGTTGHSNGPHLHFEVDSLKDCIGVTTKGERGSIPVVFVTRQANHVAPHVGDSYTAE